ncbi:MAG: sulfite exporter TauE/SafE family protein [Sulfuricaulis sp.]|uniref:sulfite exporter TauE/SafE family protein n=1 Tax=Sulfuricaulis sp. TaxID=2003553 RepID=UPI0034A0EC57
MFIDPTELPWLLAFVGLTAVLYSSVGHGGASGYLAAMVLLGVAPTAMKPAALVMNIVVTLLVSVRLYRAGYFRWGVFWPFAISSVPMAFVGGGMRIADPIYMYVVGLALLTAAARLWIKCQGPENPCPTKMWVAMPLGAVLGFVSGLTGVGGGIFLSPLLLFLRWTTVRTTAAVSAAFILVNSISGLVGFAGNAPVWSMKLPLLAGAALTGAWVGSEFAARRLAPSSLNRVLGIVLGIAGCKMFLIA